MVRKSTTAFTHDWSRSAILVYVCEPWLTWYSIGLLKTRCGMYSVGNAIQLLAVFSTSNFLGFWQCYVDPQKLHFEVQNSEFKCFPLTRACLHHHALFHYLMSNSSKVIRGIVRVHFFIRFLNGKTMTKRPLPHSVPYCRVAWLSEHSASRPSSQNSHQKFWHVPRRYLLFYEVCQATDTCTANFFGEKLNLALKLKKLQCWWTYPHIALY